MSDKIAGTVAKVLSDREVVLNRGAKDGVKIGDYIGIIDEEASKVPDPDTGDELGELTQFKTSLRITQLSESLSIASTYRVRRVNRGGLGMGMKALEMGRLLREPDWVDEPETMNVDPESMAANQGTPVVAVGDAFLVVDKDVADSGYML